MRTILTLALSVVLQSVTCLAEEAKPRILNSPLYEIQWNELKGFIRATGHHHGLIFTEGQDGKPVTKGRMCMLNLEHYSEKGKTAPFLPRDEKLHSHTKTGDAVTLTVKATEEWPLTSAIAYDFSNPEFITVTFTFEFHRGFSQFEAFVASYMADWTPPLIKAGGTWVRPFPEKRYQMFVPRDDSVAGWPVDGRWDWFPDSLDPIVSPLRYDIPVLVSRNDATGWALIQMVEPDKISALSPNTFAPAHDLALVGQDVKAGEVVPVPVRLLYRKVDRMDQVDQWYKEFLEDSKGSR